MRDSLYEVATSSTHPSSRNDPTDARGSLQSFRTPSDPVPAGASKEIKQVLFRFGTVARKESGVKPPQSNECWRIFGLLRLDEAFFVGHAEQHSLAKAAALVFIEFLALLRSAGHKSF